MAHPATPSGNHAPFQNLPRRVLAPLPLPLLQPLLKRIVRNVARSRPELFSRLGPHQQKVFLIDPVNLPFVFLLTPLAESPRLQARRRSEDLPHDARIAGTFLTLLNMIDGGLDGDALFFTRDLMIDGDTEAIVVLRNALDDLEGSIIDDVALQLGPLGKTALAIFRRIRG